MFSYRDFIFIKDNNGNYQHVDCSKKQHILWKTSENWIEYNKNDKIVVFVYQGKILGDTFFFTLAFTTKENFAKRFSEDFDFDKICKIGTNFETFLEVQEYLNYKFGYKKENIFAENNDSNCKYKLGIFDY
ncbi:MAG: hypothetical protein IJX16_05795 [Clostridia bacterium]|nr:hypothetical protein [Clostridia bacterium]